jgi:TetR/AcrR family transcriptional regulator
MSRPARVSPDRILAAAAPEFAARGFAGARVDRIARRARVNKAMLYYHFHSKQGLYRALLRATFGRAAERLQAIAASGDSPQEQLDRVITAIAGLVREEQFLAAIMLREIAESGAHLDPATLEALARLPRIVGGIIQRGVDEGVFGPVHPLAAYFSMLAPMVVYFAGAPIRRQLAARHLVNGPPIDDEHFIRHIQNTMRRALERSGDGGTRAQR